MLWKAVIGITFLCAVAAVDSSPVECGLERAERCLTPFQDHLEKGVAALASMSDHDLATACWNCDVASKCISYLLYFCSDVKAKYKSQLDQFKYACSHVADKDEFWPLMGNFSAIVRSNASSVSDADSHKTSFWLTNPELVGVKEAAAFGLTFVLVMICVVAEIITCIHVRRRVDESKKLRGVKFSAESQAMVSPTAC